VVAFYGKRDGRPFNNPEVEEIFFTGALNLLAVARQN